MNTKINTSEQILIAIRRVIRAVDQHSKKLVQSHGLTGPQAVILNELVKNGPMTGSQLGKNISLSQATVTDIVRRLEQKGLLTRARDSVDKRKFLLLPTKSAKQMMLASVPLLQQSFTERLTELKDWEQTQLLSSLQRIAEMMDAEDLDAAPMLASGAVNAPSEAVEAAIDPG